MKKPRQPIVRIDQSSLRRSLRSSGVLRCVSVSQMKERNDREGGFFFSCGSVSAMAYFRCSMFNDSSSGGRRRGPVETEFCGQEPLVFISPANVVLVPASTSFYSSKISLGIRRVVNCPPSRTRSRRWHQMCTAGDHRGVVVQNETSRPHEPASPRHPYQPPHCLREGNQNGRMQHRCRHTGQSKFRSERRWGIVRVGVVQDANGRDDGEIALVQYRHGMSP